MSWARRASSRTRPYPQRSWNGYARVQGHVIIISDGLEDYWEIAKANGLWAGRRNVPVERGDLLFYWQAKQGLKYLARATTDAQEVRPGERLPWPNAQTHPYSRKFGIEVLDELTAPVDLSWAELQVTIESGALASNGHIVVPEPDAVERLRGLFPERHDKLVLDAEDLDLDDVDRRDRAVRDVAVRRGQRRFRAELLRAYAGTCAITRSTAVPALEAAHIEPYRGTPTNDLRNGLLLRADVHTLFDLQLVTVLPVGVIRVSPTLEGSEYEDLDERMARLPEVAGDRPAQLALSRHNEACTWLS